MIVDDFENNNADYIFGDDLIHFNIKRSLGQEFFHAMKRNRTKPAQVIVDTEELDTYEDVLLRSIRTALKFKSRGLSNEDVICLCTNNHKNSVIPIIASLFLNIKVASLDPTLSQRDTTYLINLIKPKIFFVIPEALELIENSLNELNYNAQTVLFGDQNFDQDYEWFGDYLEEEDDENDFEPEGISDIFDTAVIFFSSGTTGSPKGVCISNYALIWQACNMRYVEYINKNSTVLSYSSMYWISGMIFLSSSIIWGATRIVCSKFNEDQLWNLIDQYKITFLFMAPSQGMAMIKTGRPNELDTSNLVAACLGGASFPDHYMQALRDLLPGTFVIQGYGQTEICGLATMFNISKVVDTLLIYQKPGSIGKPIPGIFYKVIDPETEEPCKQFQRGELRLKSKLVMNGYFNKNSSEAFDEDGWLKTGDIVYFDDDFCFYIVDRIKEMLKYRSFQIAPTAIENILKQHPAVAQTVVIGIPHDEDGDHPMAVIVLHEEFSHVSEEEIQSWAQENLSEREQLRGGVKFIDSIPLTASGKLRRKLIKDMVLSGEI